MNKHPEHRGSPAPTEISFEKMRMKKRYIFQAVRFSAEETVLGFFQEEEKHLLKLTMRLWEAWGLSPSPSICVWLSQELVAKPSREFISALPS